LIPAAASCLPRSIAAWGLPGASPSWPPGPPRSDEWPTTLYVLKREKLTGLAVGALDDGLVLTEEQAADVIDAHATALSTCLYLDRLLLAVTDRLEADGVTPTVLKGPSLALSLYPDPALRLYNDVDLLIQPDHWDRAVAMLEGEGSQVMYGEPRPGWARRFSKGTVVRTETGWELDLHRTFVRGPLGLAVALEDLAADTSTIELGGRSLRTLGPETSFLHCCFNAVLADKPPRWVAVRDLAQHLLAGVMDETRVLELARRWRAEVVVARAVQTASDLLSVDPLPMEAWAIGYEPSWWDRAALLAYDDPRHNGGREALLGLLAVPGVRARIDYLWPLAFPQRSYFRGRHSSRTARLRHAVRDLRSRR
jgi:hypothetical protein